MNPGEEEKPTRETRKEGSSGRGRQVPGEEWTEVK